MARPTSIISLQADQPHLDHMRICVFSHPGEGKTVLAGTAPRCLIIDSDGTTALAARSQGSNAHVAQKVFDYHKLDEIYRHLREDKHPYEWVWWDSATLFQRRALADDIMPQTVLENPNRKKSGGEWVPDRREYMINMNRVMQYVRLFADLPMNFGVSAHVTVQEEMDGTTIYMPDIQGKGMPGSLCGYMNVVGYLTKATEGGTQRQRLITRRQGKFYAKDQFDSFGSYVDYPTIPKLMQAITEKRKSA